VAAAALGKVAPNPQLRSLGVRPHHQLYLCFFLLSLTVGSMFSRLPDIQVALGANKATLGLVLIGLSCGAFIGLTIAAPIIARFGERLSIMVPLCVVAICAVLVTLAPTPLYAFATLFVLGVFISVLEVCLNLETDRHSAMLERGIMSRAHSMWSAGFFVAALIGSGFRDVQVATNLHLLLIGLSVILVVMLVVSKIIPADARPDEAQSEAPIFAVPTIGMVGLCIVVAAPMLAEGAGVDWSLIFMRDAFAAEPLVSGMALSGFTLAMAVARWFADPIVDHFGRKKTAGFLLALTGIGASTIVLAPVPLVAVCGFVIMGIGCSAVYPITISAVAQRTDRPAAVNVAALGQSAFVILFLGPPLLGFIAEHFGVRSAYLACLPIVAAGLFFLNSLNRK